MNNKTTGPPNHPSLSLSQDVGICRGHGIVTCHGILQSPPNMQALAPSAPISLRPKSMFVMDLFSFSTSARASRQWQINVDVQISGRYRRILITQILRTHDTELTHVWMSLIQNLAHNSEIDSCLQDSIYIFDHIWQLFLNRYEHPPCVASQTAFSRLYSE